ncbi:hypothetical protein [Noviherbaspirillum aerium]|uniref:hypothetical protein n=1 Tax=Noviherbaspirillum aerium TaxID=2588497 RepID=UPI00124EE12D|nr:hypothetical protein [Noviherbaspirillum aerium]
MEFSKSDIKKLTSALDIQRYRRTRQRKFPQTEYVTLVDKFFANKPVTLTEMNEICATEATRWAYIQSLLQIFPAHAALALEGSWNGETIANGMMLAHAFTKATVFLPIDDFIYGFANIMRHADEGGVSFLEVAQSAVKAKDLDDKCYEIFTGWIGDAIGSREGTLDLAMHTAGERFFALGTALGERVTTSNAARDDAACIDFVKELLLGDRDIQLTRKKNRDISGAGISV